MPLDSIDSEVWCRLLQVLESTLPFESKFGAILVDHGKKGEFKVGRRHLAIWMCPGQRLTALLTAAGSQGESPRRS